MQVHVAPPAVVARVALADAVREGTSTGVDETLRSRPVPVVRIAVIPSHASAQLHLVLFLVADVQRTGLRLALSLSVAASPSSASAEVTVVHVVGVPHKRIAHVTKGLHRRQTDAVATVRTDAHVRIRLQTFSDTTPCDKLQHEVVVTVVDTRQAAQVALLVVGLHLFHHIRGKVLHHRIVVARHEVPAVQPEALHVLAVDADLAVVVDLRTGQRLHQRLDDRTLGHAVGIGIIHHRIILDDHLRHVGRHHRLFQVGGIGLQCYRAERLGVASRQRHALFCRLVTQVRDA